MKMVELRCEIDENEIKLCKHVSIYGAEPSCKFPEYVEHIFIRCKQCDVVHDVEIAIN